ncbi:olfactory receptor 10G4-like [Chanos chanos]|uniref:Olfactory receptor 10G4-like n=1 Tax=Chanos chanos TaxID=29144 RepID=A0A6J2WV01_CHACN|nr:olfactory receptor 10G4-like [Chanos chanos]
MNPGNDTGVRVQQFTIIGFDHLSHQKLLGCLILMSYSLTLLGSGTNICLILTERRLHRPMYILICNLALVDIVFTTCASTTMISVLLAEMKTISYYSCFSRMYAFHVGDITTCLALSLMAVDRLVAISLPLRYHSILTNSRIFMLIALTWLIAICVMIPLGLIIVNLPYCQPTIRYVYCDYPAMVRAACADPEPSFRTPTIIGVWVLCGQLPFVFLTYVKIAYTVLKLPNKESQRQMIETCTSHVIAVACYFVPKVVSMLLTRIGVKLNLTERNSVVIVSSTVPSLLNPIVYCLRTKEIRMQLLKILSNLMARKESPSVRTKKQYFT